MASGPSPLPDCTLALPTHPPLPGPCFPPSCPHAPPPVGAQSWSFDTLVGFFAAFVALPALLELLTFVFVTRFSFLKY